MSDPDASELSDSKTGISTGTIANRIVEQALNRKLASSLDRHFSERSFGFRLGRSPRRRLSRFARQFAKAPTGH